MKNLLTIVMALAIAFLALSARAEVVYEDDFESYAANTELVGTVAGWKFFGSYVGTSTIVANSDKTKSLKLEKTTGGSADYDMVLTPTFGTTSTSKGCTLMKFSYKVKPSSNTDIFALYTTKEGEDGELVYADRFFYLNAQVNDGKLTTSPGSVTFENIDKDGEWNEISFLFDAMNGRVVNVTCNGESKDCNIAVEATYNPDVPFLLRLSTQFSSQSAFTKTYYDYFKVETIGRFEEPTIFGPDSVNMNIEETEKVLKIYNAGPDGEISFNITTDADWLTINPTSGTLTDEKTIYLQANSELPRDFYKGTITVDGGAFGKKVINATWQNGFFYKSDFDSLELGNILPQASEYQPIYSAAADDRTIATYDVVSGGSGSNEKALAIDQIGNYGGLHVGFANTQGWAAKYNIKISYDIFWGDNTANGYFGSNDGYCGEFTWNDNDGLMRVHSNGASYDFPVNVEYRNKWVPISYTVNTMEGNHKLLAMSVGDYETNDLDLACNTTAGDAYIRLRLFLWGGNSMKVDNIVAEAVKRETSGPELEVTGGGVAYLGTNTLSMTVFNLGTGELGFESTVTEGSGWLSIREAEGADTYSGTIVDTNSQKLNLDIDRAALGATYGRAKIVTTGGDKVKTINVCVQGSSDDGAVFYANDFESTDLGVITTVDPAWLNSNAKVIIDDDNRCMSIQGAGQLHFRAKIPQGLSDRFNFRMSCKVKAPVAGGSYPQVTFGTELSHRHGEYTLNSDGETLVFRAADCEISDFATNEPPVNTWVPLSYTYTPDPLNRKLYSCTFGDSTYDFTDNYINASPGSETDNFTEFRFYIWSDGDPWYMDDICLEAVPRSSEPPIMTVTAPSCPVTYDQDEIEIVVRNEGGSYYKFQSEVVEGAEYLKAATNGTVYGSFKYKAKIDRSKLGVGFYRPVIRFTSDKEEKVCDLCLGIQSGNATEGYIIYEDNFNDLQLTTETEGAVENELSDQDPCWQKNSAHNRIDIAEDPAGSGERVACCINVNDWTKYIGYYLNLNVKADVWDSFDLVYSMDMYIPDSFVDRKEGDHTSAAFYVSQDNKHRQCEFVFYLDEDNADLPVAVHAEDITNTSWWEDMATAGTLDPVSNNTWFRFYERLNCKCVDFDHKTINAVTVGNNEFQMEGDNSTLTYPGGIAEDVFVNEAMPTMKLWCYCDDAQICMKNIRVMLVPKGLPEPAFLGVLALLALAFSRKRG